MASKSIIRPTGYIECQVQRPAKGEGDSKCYDSAKWVVKVLGVPTNGGFLLGDKYFITIKGSCIGVMAAMAILPREVGDKEARVEDKANSVVKPLIVTEGMVATFMSYNPNSS